MKKAVIINTKKHYDRAMQIFEKLDFIWMSGHIPSDYDPCLLFPMFIEYSEDNFLMCGNMGSLGSESLDCIQYRKFAKEMLIRKKESDESKSSSD